MHKRILQLALFVPIVLVLSLVASTSLFAVTGKIAGRVTDADTGEPLPGVNVIIEGTTMGGSTDLQGRYFILNVPPGVYSLKASFMGYTAVTKTGVRVVTGMTAEVDFQLSPTVIEGQAVTVVAERPLVEKTLTQSKTTMEAQELDHRLPVGSYRDLVETAASTFSGYVRGGRKYETKYLVDGVDVSDTYFSGGTGAFGTLDVGHVYQAFRRSEIRETAMTEMLSSAIQELNVYAGTFTAEYPTASAGIVNMVTKSGGQNYTGKIFVRGTPLDKIEHFGTNPYYMKDSKKDAQGNIVQIGYFDERDKLAASSAIKDQRSAQLYTWSEQLAKDKYYYDPNDSVGLGRSYEVEGNLSGPLPFTGGKGGFFLTGRYQNLRTSAMPFDLDKRIVSSLKLHYDFTKDMRVTLYGQIDDGGKLFNFVNWKFNPKWLYYMEGAPRYKDLGLVAYAKWTHTLSPKTFYEIQISQSNKTSELGYPDDNGDGYCDIDEKGDFIDFDSREEYLRYVGGVTKTDPATGITYIDWTTVNGYVGNYLNEHPDAVLGPRDPNRTFFYSAIDQTYMENKVNFWTTGGLFRPRYPAALYSRTTRNVTAIKGDLTSQITYNHQIKTGFQFRYHYVDVDNKQAELGGAGHQYPMECFHVDMHTFYPKELGFYLQDRIEYMGMIVNVGARVDGYDNDTRRFKNDFHPWDYIADAMGALWELRPVRGEKVGWKWFFSPRLGVSHPISDRMAMHYSFGKFIQYPNFASLYSDYNFTNYSASPSMTTVWVDQEPMRSTAYEIGLQWAPVLDISLDAVVYYRDVENYGNRLWGLTPYKGQGLYIRSSWGHADSRGIELTIEKRRTGFWSGRLTYAYSYIKAAQARTGNDPTQLTNFSAKTDSANYGQLPLKWADYYPYREDNIVVRETENPLAGGFDRTHRFGATLLFYLPFDFELSAVGNAMSGFKYLPTENIDLDPWFAVSPKMREGPWNYWLNLRLTWEGKLAGIRFRPFVEVDNVTNKENILAYNRTPFYENIDQKIFELGRDGKPKSGDEGDPKGYWNVPFDWLGRPLYGPARQIWAGLEIGF
ncbi:MAG: TonB-dependent receptor [candidate division KSB1 bacterium]|nr:TonB-dependent receptor [candidate division KSB1 bacterium]MDZ7392071.1 TonB-dependent receptor [candidate division KSB1 bacterium]